MKWTAGDEALAELRQRFADARKSEQRWERFAETLDDDESLGVVVEWAMFGPDIKLHRIGAHARQLGTAVNLALDEGNEVTISRDHERHVIEADVTYERYRGRAAHDYLACRGRRGHDCRARAVCAALLDLYSPREEELDSEVLAAEDAEEVERLRAANPDATISRLRWYAAGSGGPVLDVPVAIHGPIDDLAAMLRDAAKEP